MRRASRDRRDQVIEIKAGAPLPFVESPLLVAVVRIIIPIGMSVPAPVAASVPVMTLVPVVTIPVVTSVPVMTFVPAVMGERGGGRDRQNSDQNQTGK